MFRLTDFIPKKTLADFCHRHHISRLAVFGSALKNQLTPESDVDILVEFKPDNIPGLMDLAGMEIELTDKLGRRVDLRTPSELSRYFRGDVLSNARIEYDG